MAEWSLPFLLSVLHASLSCQAHALGTMREMFRGDNNTSEDHYRTAMLKLSTCGKFMRLLMKVGDKSFKI